MHEPKGADAAAANRVYVSDGLGSGSWTTVTNDVLASTAKSFQGQLLHLQNRQTTGTAGGSISTAASFQTRTLNTVVTNEISGASLSSNIITLPAGTYYADITGSGGISWTESGSQSPGFKIRLYNNTAGTSLLEGLNCCVGHATTSSDTGGSSLSSTIKGVFTLGVSSDLIFQMIKTRTGHNALSEGFASSAGGHEVYSDVLIWKRS